MKTLLIHVCSNFINEEKVLRATTFDCDLIDTGRSNIAGSVNNAYILFDGDMHADAIKDVLTSSGKEFGIHITQSDFEYPDDNKLTIDLSYYLLDIGVIPASEILPDVRVFVYIAPNWGLNAVRVGEAVHRPDVVYTPNTLLSTKDPYTYIVAAALHAVTHLRNSDGGFIEPSAFTLSTIQKWIYHYKHAVQMVLKKQ